MITPKPKAPTFEPGQIVALRDDRNKHLNHWRVLGELPGGAIRIMRLGRASENSFTCMNAQPTHIERVYL